MEEDPINRTDIETVPNENPVSPRNPTRHIPTPVVAQALDEAQELQRHLSQYRVRELVGRGGMGNVLKVDDPKLAAPSRSRR